MTGRGSMKSQSPYPSSVMAVNPAGVRGKWLGLPRENSGAVPEFED